MLASADTLYLTGQPLDFATLEAIGAATRRPVACEIGMGRIGASRLVITDRLATGLPIYGANTGVGSMKDKLWTADDLVEFNNSLVRAHHFGTGEPFALPIVRKAMAIRVNTALGGYSGCSPELIGAFLGLLEKDVVPVVRRHGSMGCADIGLMGQIASVMTGEGEAWFGGVRLPAADALKRAGLKPYRMQPRDALAALSVNAISHAAAANVVREAAKAIRNLMVTGLLSSLALGASADPWRVAARLSAHGEALAGCWFEAQASSGHWPKPSAIHDPLSLRMTAQVFGACLDTLMNAAERIVEATAQSDDNPVVIDNHVMASGGSLPLSTTLYVEAAQTGFAHLARNVLNRCVLLSNGVRRNLPVNLVAPGEAATGFGPLLKLAVELYMRIQSLAVPISAQSIVVAGGLEEEATFLPLIVERMESQVRDLHQLAALEAMLSAQAIDLAGDNPEGVAAIVYQRTRAVSPFYRKDRPLSAEIEALDRDLASPEALAAFVEAAPMAGFDAFFALTP
ncbi:histidine ammonia-lyase [Shinella kummerowiae]|jgi:histidine ammonia-lyase|uniref:Histidine ammonia-lyase n=1 Tax=Shinella kummerowiae TaxID=417745 RepID=A0A6N8S4L3_9HYPH|nr:aromatic amino acid lyase [Shinella kummerowiae]MXN43989.1 histidine ammonia-lyase [Shinella kummerowiae]